jgi:signal transduction histidine kinase
VAQTKTLVIDEVDRMHRLVEDLLVIAKSEQSDFIQPQLTDIALLTDETFQKATALGKRTWKLDQLADVEVRLDPQRTAQAWLQLAANAVQYSENGALIGLGSQVSGDRLQLWVRDEGFGISPSDLEDIEKRQVQGNHRRLLSSDTNSGDGHKGLGLAIVNRIVTAQNGNMSIDSVLGKGSRFTLEFPI